MRRAATHRDAELAVEGSPASDNGEAGASRDAATGARLRTQGTKLSLAFRRRRSGGPRRRQAGPGMSSSGHGDPARARTSTETRWPAKLLVDAVMEEALRVQMDAPVSRRRSGKDWVGCC